MSLFCSILLFIITIFVLRLYYITSVYKNTKKSCKHHISALIVLGSGGHSTEMVRLVEKLDPTYYSPQCYVLANTDKWSRNKVIHSKINKHSKMKWCEIPRSREVGQSYITSIITTLIALIYSFKLVYKENPDLILVNGPGTCIPICIVGFIYKLLGISNIKIVFFESICRVKTLSLSGKILYYMNIADLIMVQWPELKMIYPKVEYHGKLF